MGKVVTLVVLIVVAAWLIRRALARMSAPSVRRPSESGAVPDELVRCAHCGVLVPRGEARASAGVLYCSEEHARLGPTRKPGAR